MSKFKLSKTFYVDPKTLPDPYIPPCHDPDLNAPPYSAIRKDILTNGFNSDRPIIINMNRKIADGYGRCGSIMDGNHRLAISLELKLKKIPVQFVLN